MAINFPDNPSTGQTYSVGGRVWQWTGYAWRRIPDPGAKGQKGQAASKGQKGEQNDKGQKGQEGNFGGVTFDYTYLTDNADSDPGDGKLKFNGTALHTTSPLILYIDDVDDASRDIQSFLRTIDDSTSLLKGHFRISNKSDSTDYAIFSITGASTEASGYFKIPCTHLDGATSFSNNEDIIITFARTGDIGDKGQKGEVGEKGQKGEVGEKGQKGQDGAVAEKGQKGEVGQKGQKGQQGEKGQKGEEGDKGQKGATGADNSTKGQKGNKGSAGVAGLDIDTSPPSNPTVGDLWWESDTGHLYVYYNDGNSNQWVAVSQGPAGSPGGQAPFVSNWQIPV